MLKVEEKQLKKLQNISKIIGVLSFGAFIILLIFLGYLSHSIHDDISTSRDELIKQNEELENKNAEIFNRQAEINKLDQELVNKKELVNAQANVIQDISKDTTKAAIKKVIEKNPNAAGSLPRVYLHIEDESGREKIEKISEKLQLGGYIVSKVEIVGAIAPKDSQLRYCRDKEQQDDLVRIQQILNEINVSIKILPIPDWIDCKNVAVRSYEFWLESNTANQRKANKPLG